MNSVPASDDDAGAHVAIQITGDPQALTRGLQIFADSLTPGVIRDLRAMAALADRWRERDPDGLSDEIRKLKLRDFKTMGLVRAAERRGRRSRLELLSTDPEYRAWADAAVAKYRELRRKDPSISLPVIAEYHLHISESTLKRILKDSARNN